MARISALVLAVLAVGALATPAAAQQSLSLNIGYFTVSGEGSRVQGDTIEANLNATGGFALAYHVSDFNNVTFGGEWLFPLGNFLEGGVGVNYYARTVNSFYRDLVNPDGSDITQDIRLRTVPITGTVRFIMTGRRATVQPYIGAGVAIIPWHYSESGNFADPSYNIFQWDYVDSGTAVGPVVFGGLRVAFSRQFALGGEVRFQHATTSLNPNVGFMGDHLDLGGITYQTNFLIRF